MENEFEIENKTGFITNDKSILIYDQFKEPFYIFNEAEILHKFNLPKGLYYSENNILKLNKPVEYKLPSLPKRERKMNLPKKILFRYTNNPHQASIFLEAGAVLMDRSQQGKSRLNFLFKMAHELGHYYFYTEKYCDLFSAKLLLRYGLNPSQIGRANFNTLSNKYESLNRKKFLINKLTKLYTNGN